MPAYHSRKNEDGDAEACSCAICPLRTELKGPAQQIEEGKEDIIEETLNYFRANVLFRNFEVRGPADRTMIYLTLHAVQCLVKCERIEDKNSALRELRALSIKPFVLPGEPGFPLGGLLAAPATKAESDLFRTYMKQAREELCIRLCDRLFDADGTKNKWWQLLVMMQEEIQLSAILKNAYNSSRFDGDAGTKMLQEVDDKKLVLSGSEILDTDIPIFCKFLKNPTVVSSIETLEINKSSGGRGKKRDPGKNAVQTSAFTVSGHILFKEIVVFIKKATNLKSISFESIPIRKEWLGVLGKALVQQRTELSWLSFKSCDIGGSSGLTILAPYIGQLRLQVLAIEHCDLNESSVPAITSIVKAQENACDSLYWNANLRVDPTYETEWTIENETKFVYSSGLVALSLYGNKFDGTKLQTLTETLKHNLWLLGLNLAGNNIGKEQLSRIAWDFVKNKALLCILLKGNPGLDGSISSILLDTVKENSINSHLGKFFSGNKRLDYLSPPLANLLLRWKGLQRNETVKTFMHDISMYSNIEEAEKELLSGSNNYINVPKNNFSGHYSATEQVANVSRIKLVEDRAFSDNIGKLNSPKLVDQKASSRYDTDSFSGDDLDKWKSRILNNNSNNNRHNSNHHDVNEEMITFRGLDRDEEDLPLLDDRIDSFTTRGIDTAKDKIMDDPFEYAVPSPRNQGYELPWNFTPKNRNYTDRPPSRMSMRPRRTNNPPSKSTQGRLEGVSKGRTSTIYMSSSPSYQKSTNNARNSMALVLSHEGELITRPISAPYISKSRSMEAPNSVLCKNNERPKLKRKKVKSSKAPSDKVVIGKSVAETRISARKRASRSPELAGKIDRKSFEKVRGRSSEKDKSLVVSLTKSVQIVTHNLEEVSSKLKDLTSTLSESMHLSLSMQREASNALALSLTPGVTYPNKTPASAQKATWSTGKPLAAAELASSPESHVEKLENRDSELGNLIRQRMHEKLRDIINPSFSI